MRDILSPQVFCNLLLDVPGLRFGIAIREVGGSVVAWHRYHATRLAGFYWTQSTEVAGFVTLVEFAIELAYQLPFAGDI